LDVRVIAATNADLKGKVARGEFRQDLYYRLSVFPIGLPPLRDRSEDILPLAEKFLEKMSAQSRLPKKQLSVAAGRYLCRQAWPGNVRELQHAVERALILSDTDGCLRLEHFSSMAFSGLENS
jgi:two-component system response regulator FlrC